MVNDFKKQVWLTLAILGGAGLVFGSAYYFSVQRINAQVQEIVRQRALIRQSSTITQTLANLKQEGQAAEPYKQAMERLVATRDQLIVNFSDWLTREASIYGAGVSFSFQGSETKPTPDDFGSAGFSIKLSGHFRDIVGLLKYLELESPQFLITFNDFDVSQSNGGYNVAADGKVFFN
ncbi:MAG: hypothetical protein HY093_03480 [Candidatus Liptonbacteria bacterium]|nr:hypothetical protein [Candidatus Liptonbacteria bacterium]